MVNRCPACERGTVTDDHCDRCGVWLARGCRDVWSGPRAYFKSRQDQDEPGPTTDYARTKADKA